MVCLVCRRPAPALCGACRGSVRPAPVLRTPGGIEVRSWARHEAAAAVLVRRLKYEGVRAVATLVAPEVARLLPPDGRCLVPVPRSLARRIRYGIDAAAGIAAAVADLTGLPVVHALGAEFWTPANAGASASRRVPPAFRRRASPPGAVLVDDVVTTGATLDSAATTLGSVVGALTISCVP